MRDLESVQSNRYWRQESGSQKLSLRGPDERLKRANMNLQVLRESIQRDSDAFTLDETLSNINVVIDRESMEQIETMDVQPSNLTRKFLAIQWEEEKEPPSYLQVRSQTPKKDLPNLYDRFS